MGADEHDWLDRLLDDQGLGGDGGKAFLFGEEIYEHVMIDKMIVEGEKFKVENDASLLGELIQGEIRSIRADLANMPDTRIIVASPCRDNNPLIVTGTEVNLENIEMVTKENTSLAKEKQMDIRMKPAVSRKLRFDEITAGTCDQPSQAEVVMVGKVRRQVEEFKSKQKDQVELQDEIMVVRKVDCQGTKVMGLKNIYEVKNNSNAEDSRVMSRKAGVIGKLWWQEESGRKLEEGPRKVYL